VELPVSYHLTPLTIDPNTLFKMEAEEREIDEELESSKKTKRETRKKTSGNKERKEEERNKFIYLGFA
jgi:nitric oxide reductase activation protein